MVAIQTEMPVYVGIRSLVCPTCGTPLKVRRVEPGVVLITGVFVPAHGRYKALCCGVEFTASTASELKTAVEQHVARMPGRHICR